MGFLFRARTFCFSDASPLLFSPGFAELDTSGLISAEDERRYSSMEQALNDHNVAVYPIVLTPVAVRHLQNQNRLLAALALDTGGLYFHDPISFGAPLLQVSEDNVGYYLISYQSERPAAAAGYQRVVVRARDPAIRLRARKGYRYGSE